MMTMRRVNYSGPFRQESQQGKKSSDIITCNDDTFLYYIKLKFYNMANVIYS